MLSSKKMEECVDLMMDSSDVDVVAEAIFKLRGKASSSLQCNPEPLAFSKFGSSNNREFLFGSIESAQPREVVGGVIEIQTLLLNGSGTPYSPNRKRSFAEREASSSYINSSGSEEDDETHSRSRRRKTSSNSNVCSISSSRQRSVDINSRSKPQPFKKRFQELIEYKQLFGHTNVSRGDPEEWRSLAHWVNNQRSTRRLGKLKEDRIKKLDSIGFQWEVRTPRKYFNNWTLNATPKESSEDEVPYSSSDEDLGYYSALSEEDEFVIEEYSSPLRRK